MKTWSAIGDAEAIIEFSCKSLEPFWYVLIYVP